MTRMLAATTTGFDPLPPSPAPAPGRLGVERPRKAAKNTTRPTTSQNAMSAHTAIATRDPIAPPGRGDAPSVAPSSPPPLREEQNRRRDGAEVPATARPGGA